MSNTRTLRKWIDDQLARGCLPADLVTSLIAAGHHSQAAHTAIHEGMQRAAAVPGLQPAPSSTPLTTPQPLRHSLATGGAVIVADDRNVAVLMSLAKPRALLLGKVLDDSECDALIAASRARMQRSKTVDRSDGTSQLHAARSSDGCHFQHHETPLLDTINRRIASLTGWPLENGEPLQVLHYGVGAEYEPHYDYFDPADPGSARLTAIGGQRVGTLILYLNTPEAGGATVFPAAGLEIAAIKGNALFFSYDQPHPDSATLHAGTPVTAGEKWIATRWMRQRPYQS